MKLNKKIIAAMLAISMVTVTAENNVMMAEAASKPSVTKNLTITEGKKKTITVKGSFIKSKSFKSTNKSIAVVNKKGVVTAVSKGKCKVKVTVKYTKSKKAKKVLKKEFVTNVTVKAKKKPEETKKPEVTQNPSDQPTSAPGTTPGTDVTKEPSSNTDVTTAPQSSAPEMTPAAPTGTPAATSAPTATAKATDTPKTTANPGVTVKPDTPGSSQIYYPINKPSVKNTPKPTPAKTPEPGQTTPPATSVENVIIDLDKVEAKVNAWGDNEGATNQGVKFINSSMSYINFNDCLPEGFDLEHFKEVKVGYEIETNTEIIIGGKIALAADKNDLNGYSGGVAEYSEVSSGGKEAIISLTDKSGNKLTGPAAGINIQLNGGTWNDKLPATWGSITITSIEFIAIEDATEPTPPVAQTTPPAAQTTPPVAQTTPPAAQTTPPAAQTTPPAAQTTPMPEPKPGDIVTNVTIDLAKAKVSNGSTVTGQEVKFTKGDNWIDFESQIFKVFDLKYFKGLEVKYTLKFTDESKTSELDSGKIAVVKSKENLNGQYDDKVALTYDMKPGKDTVLIDFTGKNVTGAAVGINIQPMNSKAGYSWPESLESVTITSIVFVAKEGATYPSTTTPPPAQTTEPTTPTTPMPEPKPGDTVTNVTIDLAKAKVSNGSTVTGQEVKFTKGDNWIDFESQIFKVFDLKYFKGLEVKYTLKFTDESKTSELDSGKIAVVKSKENLNGQYDDKVALTYDMKPGKDTVLIDFTGKNVTGAAVGINIQPMNSKASYSWPESLESVTINSIVFIAKDDMKYEEEATE